MFKTLPKAVAVIYWRHPGMKDAAWNYNGAFAGDTMQQAAQIAEGVRRTLNQGLEYSVLCGEYTHKAEPPTPISPTLVSLRD